MGSYQGKVYNTPEEAEEYVKTTIEAHDVVLFTKRFSPYCYKATSSFKSINVPYEEILLSGRPDCQVIQDVLLKMTGARTVPRVFVHQKCIGGGDETSALKKENKLKALVDKTEESKPEGQQTDATQDASQTAAENQEAVSDPKEQSTKEQDADDKKDDAPAQESTQEPQQEQDAPSQEQNAPSQEQDAPSQEQDAPSQEQDAAQVPGEEVSAQEKSQD